MKRVSISTGEFLKNIWQLHEDEQLRVTVTLLARSMSISTADVSAIARKLVRSGHLKYEKYKELRLTTDGRLGAMMQLRAHRIWETYLYKEMGFDLQSVHQQALLLENGSSSELISRMDEKLGFPAFDPHGDPIPDAKGFIAVHKGAIRLSGLKRGEKGTIVRLNYSNPRFVRVYDKTGLALESVVLVEETDENDMMKLKMGDVSFELSFDTANLIFVLPE
jgi:DtxR family Mn-dependent transcriptional regulator